MVALFSTTLISCSQAIGIVNRLQHVVGLSYSQKIEIIKEVAKVIPSCPIQIVEKKK